MSDNATLAALRRMGIPKAEMSGHGFRAVARTILDEVLGFPVHLHRAPTCAQRKGRVGQELQPNHAPTAAARDDAGMG